MIRIVSGAVTLLVATSSCFANCPTVDDVQADGVWVRYTSSWGVVHYVTDGSGAIAETTFEDGEILGQTHFYGGVHPTTYHEKKDGHLRLISTIEYSDKTQLVRPQSKGSWEIAATAHYTDFAFARQKAHSDDRVVSLTIGASELLFIGSCKYKALLVKSETTSPKATFYSEAYYLPKLGIRIHKSVGQEPWPILASMTAIEITTAPPQLR